MSIKSQQTNMRRLTDILGRNLCCIGGEREAGPNGDKKAFLHIGMRFLRLLAEDLGLQSAQVRSNPGGIAVSGECTLSGMWEKNGIFLSISQPCCERERVILYRSVQDLKDHIGGQNHYLTRRAFAELSYPEFLRILRTVRKGEDASERAA